LRSVLLAPTETLHEIVVINDASPDALLTSCLRIMADCGRLTLIENSVNLGFVRTANIGLSRHPNRDVVLLNSDTEVHGNWLDRLRQSTYLTTNIGTVTPLSNNATICSYPRFAEENPLPPDVDLPALDAICAKVN